MGFLTLGLFIVLVVLIAYFLIWVLSQLAPGHPAIIDTLIWVLAVCLIVIQMAFALGLHDVPIPRVFGR